jgi:hypothetical protein
MRRGVRHTTIPSITWADTPKGATVRTLLRIGLAALVAVAATALVGSAWATSASPQKRVIPFVATFKGMATVKVTDNVADIAATGAGKATLMKATKITGKGKGDASVTPCVPFTGPGSMSNASGTKINFVVTPGSTGCGDQDESVPVSLSGHAKIVSGTKAYKKAKGTLKFTGVYDRQGGAFTIKFTGKVTVPK